MATSQFKAESPYVGRDLRTHDPTDFKYQQFLDATTDTSSDSTKPVNLALFGLGRAGSIHITNLVSNSRINLMYVVETDQSKWGKVERMCGARPTDNITEVLSNQDVQGCIIATPTFTHKDLILKCLDAGKAVFSEKPIGETPEETTQCYERSKQVGKPLFCGFQRRWDPSYANIQQRVRAGELGHVQIIKSTSRDSPLPSLDYLKISGGIYHDCAVHDIDIITWTLGELPIQVHTMANAQIPEIAAINDHDNVMSVLKFASGTIGMINVNRFAVYGYDQRLEVFGTKGMLEMENKKPNNVVHSSASGESVCPIMHSFPSRYEDSYAAELDHFVDIVQGKCPLTITHHVASAVSKIADAMEQSAKTGVPVAIAWSKEELPKGYVMRDDLKRKRM